MPPRKLAVRVDLFLCFCIHTLHAAKHTAENHEVASPGGVGETKTDVCSSRLCACTRVCERPWGATYRGSEGCETGQRLAELHCGVVAMSASRAQACVFVLSFAPAASIAPCARVSPGRSRDNAWIPAALSLSHLQTSRASSHGWSSKFRWRPKVPEIAHLPSSTLGQTFETLVCHSRDCFCRMAQGAGEGLQRHGWSAWCLKGTHRMYAMISHSYSKGIPWHDWCAAATRMARTCHGQLPRVGKCLQARARLGPVGQNHRQSCELGKTHSL